MTQPVAQTRPSVACLDPADAESKFLTVDPGVQLHYWAAGDPAAPALVFVPGLTFSGEVFCQQLQHFKATHRVILVDPRGQGLSTKCDFGNDYQTHGADLVKLVAAEQLVRPTLVGWSCGNLEVWSYVEHAGTSGLAGVVTVDMSPLPHSENPANWTEGTPEELSQIGTRILLTPEGSRAFWDEYLREVMWQGPISSEQYSWFMDMGARTPGHVARELFLDAILSDYRQAAQTAAREVPTLMFIAEHWADVAEPFYHGLCPETPTCVMGGHLMAYQYAEKFNARLEEFLAAGK